MAEVTDTFGWAISLSSGLEGYISNWLHVHSRSTWSFKLPLGWGTAAAGLLQLLAYCIKAAQWALDTASVDLLPWNTTKWPAVPSLVHCNIKWVSATFPCLSCMKSTTPPTPKHLTLFLNPQRKHRNILIQTRSPADIFLFIKYFRNTSKNNLWFSW